MKLSVFLFLAFSLIVSSAAVALPRTSVGPISARVASASGELSISGDHWSTSLLLTAKIDSHVYSNNTVPKGVTAFAPPLLGQLRDTIVVRWTTDEDVDVYLRCYPYDRDVMIEISFDNRSATDHTCDVETLQSYGVEGVTAPYLGTDRDYSNLAREVPPVGSSGGPTLFLMGQANASLDPFSPGYIAGGRFSCSGLDLRGPAHLYFGVWYSLASTAFGPPAELPVGCDGGLLLLWNPIGLPAHTADTIGRWTLTNTVNFCSSSDVVLFSMSTAMRPFQAHEFNVAAIAYSVNQRGLENPRLVMSVSDQLRILSIHDGTAAQDTFALASNLARGQCEVAEWNVMSFDASSAQNVTFSALGSNLTPLYRDGCDFSFQAPSSSIVFDNRNPYIIIDTSFGATDARECTAKRHRIDIEDSGSGIDHATITGQNFQLTPEPFIPGTDSIRVSVDVIDSLIDGSATVKFYDRSSNTISRSYTYCSVQDTAPPKIEIHSYHDSALVVVLEKRAWDRGINFFSPYSSVNATIDSSTLYQSIDSLSFVVRRVDPSRDASYCLTATDRAGNTSSPGCWTSTMNRVVASDAVMALLVTPNPVHNKLRVNADGVTIAKISVLDLLGQSMLTVAPATPGPIQIELGALPTGFYIVRVVTDVGVLSRRIEVVR